MQASNEAITKSKKDKGKDKHIKHVDEEEIDGESEKVELIHDTPRSPLEQGRTSKQQKIGDIKFEDLVLQSSLTTFSPEEQAQKIVELYNSNVKHSCFTMNPAPGRALPHRVPPNCYLLGHKNQVAELADPKGQRIAIIFQTDPLIVVESLGTVQKTHPFFGDYGKYVLNVPAGHIAKALSKNTPILLGEGPHVIIDPTFKFEPSTGFVQIISPYIQHNTLHILRVPSGKLAKVWIGTVPKILESSPTPYIFNDPQFRHVENTDGPSPFYDATDRYILHGSIKRLIPHTGEVAITYNNGILEIITPPKNISSPIIIDSATHNFDSFLKTSLQTVLFPSEETKKQMIKDNPRATSDERNLKIFQTRDSLRVGVVLVVAFKVIKPELTVSILGSDGILTHIENVAFADMGKAIQFSTLQEVMFATSTKGTSTNSIVTMQDRVRDNLAKDLNEYGIELHRLDIETLKVLDEEIAKKLAGQSVIGAEYTTKQATLVKEYDIKTTEARLLAETENIKVQQRSQALVAEAQANLDSAKKNAEATIVAAQAKKKAQQLKGELYMEFPMLYDLEMASIRTKALSETTFIVTPNELGNLMSAGAMFKKVFYDDAPMRTGTNKTPKREIEDAEDEDEEEDDDDLLQLEREKERLMELMKQKLLEKKARQAQTKQVKKAKAKNPEKVIQEKTENKQ